jgi:hypothetical protein
MMLALAATVIYRDFRSYISAPNYILSALCRNTVFLKKDEHLKTVEYFH